MLPRLRAEKMLLEGDVSGLNLQKIEQLAMLAWDDAERAKQFKKEVYRQRLEAAMSQK